MRRFELPEGAGGFGSTLKQMEAQARDLANCAEHVHRPGAGETSPEETVLCGAGDSLACAMFVERMMNFGPRALDPYDLMLSPETVKGRTVYFISVSGRTKANIKAAMAAKAGGARKTVAVTADAKSALAKTCSELIELRFTRPPQGEEGQTPGTNSFLVSLLTCAMLFRPPPGHIIDARMGPIVKWATSAAVRAAIATRPSPPSYATGYAATDAATHFVGSGPMYAIAMFGAAKMFEFAGARATYQLTEEFPHMNLFSLRRELDRVFILGLGKADEAATTLDRRLRGAGVRTRLLVPPSSACGDVLESGISLAMALQYLALGTALDGGLLRPAFLDNPLRRVAEKMLY